jgi:polysaccharide export outer membrane protein
MMQFASTVLSVVLLTTPLALQVGQAGRPTPTPPPAVAVAPTAPVLEADYRIGPEDVLSIVVLGHPDYTRVVPVRPDGRISLPLVNDVVAAGLTPVELRLGLTNSFSKFINSEGLEVSVIVTEVHSVKVSVQGNVRTPIRFELRSRATVLDALAMAGGFTDYAKRDQIIVRRVDGTVLRFNYDRFLEKPEASELIVLRGGDNVIVP